MTYLFHNNLNVSGSVLPVGTTRGRRGSLLLRKETFFLYVATSTGERSDPDKMRVMGGMRMYGSDGNNENV